MVKKRNFEVTQNRCYELILLLKVYMPSNKPEAVLFLTKNEKADPDLGVKHTPEFGCFFNIFKIQLSLLLYYSALKLATTMVLKLGDRGYPAIRFEYKRPLSDIWLLSCEQNSFVFFFEKIKL